ncbi:MAG: CHASE3 domain-containing protein [Cyanobacteria bacterium Co-bin8]|nr:CHASE3 domain-containing protein [Cyanobacteria bacterium Co-bin8]
MKGTWGEKAIATSFGLILLLLGWVSSISSKNTTELVDSTVRVQQTYEILVNLTDFFAAMNVAESGRRGYIFTGKDVELERHRQAIRSLQSELNQLQLQLQPEPLQLQRLQRLESLTQERLILFQQSIDLYQQERSATPAQNALTDRSVQVRGRIQVVLAEIQNEEKQQLNASLAESQKTIEQRFVLEQAGTALIFIFFGVTVFSLYQERLRRQRLQTLEQTLAQERELSELKLRLFSMVSHEFRTPLSVILASSQLLGEILETQIEPSYLKNLDRIQSSAKLMNQLLTDILTLTRAEAGNLEFKPEWLDIEAFCLNLLEDIQSANLTQHPLKFVSQDCCGRVYLDEKLLYWVLSNLLLNAIKYSPLYSPVQLTLSCDRNGTCFEVRDWGMGILGTDQAQMFDPFYRGKNVEGVTGSGLGLAVVKECLELFGGTISWTSDVGQGTTFVVQIPRLDPLKGSSS